MTSSPKEKSLGELLGDLARETGTLVRQEVQLAKVETTEKIGAALRGSILLVVAGVLGFAGFLALIATAILALSQVVAPWLAALIVSGVLLVVAGICAVLGLSRVKKGADIVPHQTVETLKDDARWAKEQVQ
ncbi:MAG TPA: phage holin family protein [Abditibacterium sp.]|jgi:uncharacterized membrane protein YqjE